MSLMTMSMPFASDTSLYVPASPPASPQRRTQPRAVPSSPSPKTTDDLSSGVLMYIGTLLRSISAAEVSPSTPSLPLTPPASPGRDASDTDWQAKYQSPAHTKPRASGRLAADRDSDLHHHHGHQHRVAPGPLPYFRVWELRMEERDAETQTMGRGTPPHPNRFIYKREMTATQLFLKDYTKRRGLGRANSAALVNEVEMDVRALRRKQRRNMTDEEKDAAVRARATSLKTQGKMPAKAVTAERAKRAAIVSRHSSPLTNY